MALNDVIQSFKTGTYLVYRSADGNYVDGELVFDDDPPELHPTAADAALDTLTIVGHDAITGDGPFRVIGTMPLGLDQTLAYYLVVVDADTVQLAYSAADATALVPVVVDIAADGALTGVTLSQTRFQADMIITPASGKDLEVLDEASRTMASKLVLVAEPLLTRSPGTEPDVVTYKGEDWIVFTSEEWEHWGAVHWRCIMLRGEVS